MIISGSPYSTGCSSSIRMAVTVPDARRDDLVEGLHRLDDQHACRPGLTFEPISTNGLAPGAAPR